MKFGYIILLFLLACGSKDTKNPFAYQPFSTSVIKVVFFSDPLDSVYIEAETFTNIPRDGPTSEMLHVSSKGDYFLSLITDRPNTAFLSVNNKKNNLIIFPNDTVQVNVVSNQEGIELSFAGKGAEINDYYKAKKEKFGYTDSRNAILDFFTSKNNYQSLRRGVENVMNRELDFLESYAAKQPLPVWFVQFEEAEIKYLCRGVITAMPKANEINEYFKDEVPNDYYSFIQKDWVNNQDAILSSHYFWFLDDYFIKDLPVDQFNDLVGFERYNKRQTHIIAKSKSELSGEVKDLYHKYKFSSIIKFYSDQPSIDSLAKVYEVSDYEDLLASAGTKSKNNTVGLNLNPGDTIPDFYLVNSIDSLESFSNYKDKVLYINFWATWCGPCIKNMPALNEMIKLYKDRDDIAFLNICIDSEKEKWLSSVERYKIEGHNFLAEGKWNEKVRATFNMKSIPNYVLVSKNNILFENHTDKAPAAKRLIDQLIE